MSIAWVVHWPFEVMAPFCPCRLVTWIARYLTCPKSASGTVPDLKDGTSVMTSASAFRHLDPEPALFGHRAPEIGIERLGEVHSPSVLGRPGADEGTDPFARGHPLEEVGRDLRESALIAGELELHGDEAYEPHAPVGPARPTSPRPVTS